jgi:hypothetical protein
VRRSHRRHDPVGDPPGLVMGGVGEHDSELLAADAADGVLGAGVGPQDLGEGAQGVVAGGVAERVVDRLWLDDQGITLVGPV